MFIFENKKKGHSRVVKLFGNVIYIVTSGYKRRTQRFLGDFISTQKTSDENDNEVKITKILNHVVLKRETIENYRKNYLFGNLISSIDLDKRLIKKYKKYIDGYEHIIILNSNSGEAYLFLTYVLDAFLKKNNINKNILLVATKKYHVDLIKLLHPEIPYVYIKNFPVFKNLKKIIGEQTFYSVFTGNHFIQVEEDIKNNPLDTAHYFYSILDDLNISEQELSFKNAIVPYDVQNSMLNKIRKTKLNLNNFVFIAPEAASCEEYDNEFWVDLCNRLKEKGVDVFMNIVDKDTDIIGCDYKTCNLKFAEAFALAKLSKGIVSLRSGLTESLLQTNVPIFSLYTNFRNRYVFNDMKVEYVLSGFGLNKLPNINPNKLFEFNMTETNNADVINYIATKI